MPPEITSSELRSVEALVKRHLGHPGLRPGQAETLVRVLRGEDVLAILPTGGGKSMTYQLPGVLGKGVTLIVSPLIALMKDQLDGLPPAMRAASESLTSELTPQAARRLLDELAAGRYRLLYVAPERLRNPSLLAALRQAGVARLVVDEAHCVSVWGHDFRPDYLGIADARRILGNPPVLAVTATAPPRVERDIQRVLGPLTVVRASVARPNLRLEAIEAKDADEKLAHLVALCRETPGPGVIYASSRAKCEQLAAALARSGIDADAYHAGMDDRSLRQDAFMGGRTDVLVATVAFGMGVDKRDIRFVFHHDPSSSLENYMQEAGRAGRDGLPARCVLLATSQDGGQLKRRARADAPSLELVQRAWDLVRQAADPDGYVVLDPDVVGALDPQDEVKPRVALSILAEAGAVQRLPDIPRVVVLRRTTGELARFEGHPTSPFELAPVLGVRVEEVPSRLLEMETEGKLFFQVGPRALLLRLAGDASRMAKVLDEHHAQAEGRGEEVMAYLRDAGCRHAHLQRYFGESDVAPRCGHCDNCLGVRHAPAQLDEGDDEDARRAALTVLAGMRGLGERNLVWFLRGDSQASAWLHDRPGFGALSFRSESKIKQLLRELESRGYLSRETLPHGGVTLKLTHAGADALQTRAPLAPSRPPPALASASARATTPRAAPASSSPSSRSTPAAEADDVLDPENAPVFEALKAWRRQVADAEGVPPYVVAHDRTLRAIAQARPRTADELLKVKGMGPKRVEKHGDAILAVVNGAAE